MKIINKNIFMSKKGTKKQVEIFDKLARYLDEKGYKYLGYDGPRDDSHKFGDERICCYVKFISVNAWKHPPESLKVIIRQNERNENVKEFLIGNDLYGQGSRHVFIIPADKESYKKALRLINTIRPQST